MNYISTRGNCKPIASAHAINLGMVPQGGLFVPESIPVFSSFNTKNSYQDTAREVLASYLTDFTAEEISSCVSKAYNSLNFDTPDIIDLVDIGANRSVMELWHGPTAAFKDMALQIMPHFLEVAKRKIGNKYHTVILVATSGDTGKAALEGFKNCDGISIVVFYPNGGVSEIQRLQMDTTDGKNTCVISVNGNFDDCQSGVKQLFGDGSLRNQLQMNGFEFSSANSINWGRLSPQIIYYIQSYLMLVRQNRISYGDEIDFCVPTGNFGNILAGYYAKAMGLPIRKLICASNKNNVLADFFETGIYDRNREFFRTVSPSMDILISSNLERFLFEMSGHSAGLIDSWYSELGKTGRFTADKKTMDRIRSFVDAGWVDEDNVFATIADVHRKTGYVIDTHTAVAVAVLEEKRSDNVHTVITSTASPFKFSCDVLKGIGGSSSDDEFEAVKRVAEIAGQKIHRAVDGLKSRPVCHSRTIEISQMKQSVSDIIKSIR